MSISSWRREFYPKPASKAAGSDHEALEHSIRKWEGLSRDAQKRHGLKRRAFGRIVSEGASFQFGVDSCALCTRYYDDGCFGCPLAAVGERCIDEGSAYVRFSDGGPSRPVLNALKRARRVVKERSKSQ